MKSTFIHAFAYEKLLKVLDGYYWWGKPKDIKNELENKVSGFISNLSLVKENKQDSFLTAFEINQFIMESNLFCDKLEYSSSLKEYFDTKEKLSILKEKLIDKKIFEFNLDSLQIPYNISMGGSQTSNLEKQKTFLEMQLDYINAKLKEEEDY